jgi:DNA recombination protein RmuC
MLESLVLAVLFASVVTATLTAVLLFRSGREGGGDAQALEAALREEMRAGREESSRAARELRDESAKSASALREELAKATTALRDSVDQRLKELQAGNESKLDQMRKTVDEKLHETLEKRLGESFRTVSTQLEAVHKGLGEMQSLAAGVGDLKKVLTNVKARGTWGEVQLGAILEQVLIPEQYDRNVATRRGSKEVVEFAVRLPGGSDGEVVHLPLDSKFPMEDYARLVDASEAGDADGAQRASADLARAVRKCAQDIRDKYLDPPNTTDFAILFLPTEGLFAEVLRHPGLGEELQQKFRVVVTGPTTLAATLSSLRMGFRTLAIEKRASEVWQVLSSVKTEFAKFATVLAKVKTQLETATRTIDETGVRTRAIERKLTDVESLPGEAADVLVTASVAPPESAVASTGHAARDEDRDLDVGGEG